MNTRIALITICLVCWNDKTVRAVIDWTSDTCQLSIAENTEKGSLLTLNPPDGTLTDYTYTISNQTINGQFAIDSNGVLSSKTDLDFESNEKAYSVHIVATKTDNSKTSEVTCKIQVNDVNDVGPEFVQKSYNIDVLNNVAKGTSVLTVSATDGDVSAEFKKVEYSIKAGANDSNFTMNATTGVISAKTVLAAAAPLNLTLTVVATDKNKTTLTAEVPVTVCLGCKTSSGSPGSTGSSGPSGSSGSSALGITFFASMALFTSVVRI